MRNKTQYIQSIVSNSMRSLRYTLDEYGFEVFVDSVASDVFIELKNNRDEIVDILCDTIGE